MGPELFAEIELAQIRIRTGSNRSEIHNIAQVGLFKGMEPRETQDLLTAANLARHDNVMRRRIYQDHRFCPDKALVISDKRLQSEIEEVAVLVEV